MSPRQTTINVLKDVRTQLVAVIAIAVATGMIPSRAEFDRVKDDVTKLDSTAVKVEHAVSRIEGKVDRMSELFSAIQCSQKNQPAVVAQLLQCQAQQPTSLQFPR